MTILFYQELKPKGLLKIETNILINFNPLIKEINRIMPDLNSWIILHWNKFFKSPAYYDSSNNYLCVSYNDFSDPLAGDITWIDSRHTWIGIAQKNLPEQVLIYPNCEITIDNNTFKWIDKN
jgi:hypothetical protein